MRADRGPSRQRGFSLAELLIAVTIMGLLFTVLFSALHLSGRIWDSGDQRMEEAGDIIRVQGFLRARLAQARVVPIPAALEPGHQNHILFLGEPDRLHFIAAMPAHRGGGGLHLVRLERVGDHLLLGHRLFHDAIRALDEPGWEQTVLLGGVRNLRLSYYGQRADDPEAAWHPQWLGQTRPPRLVRIDLDRPGDAHVPWPVLYADTRMTQRAGRTAAETGFGP